MLDFAQLISSATDISKRKPNVVPEQRPLPSEQAVLDFADEIVSSPSNTQNIGVETLTAPQPQAVPAMADWKAQAQSVADSPPIADNTAIVSPMVDRGAPRLPMGATTPTLDERITSAKNAYQAAVDAPVEKQSKWKDVLAYIAQGADAFFNGNRAPIVGYGKLKHDQAVDRAAGKLNPLLKMRADDTEHQAKVLDFNVKRSKAQQDAFNNDPDVLIIKESNRVTPDQAKRLNARYGTSYTPQYWGTYISEKSGGKSYIRPSDNPNFVENTSIPADPTQGYTVANINGKDVPMTMEQFGKDALERDKFNATQATAIERTNTDRENDANVQYTKDLNKYSADVVDTANKIASALASVGDSASAQEINILQQQIAQENAIYQSLGEGEERDKKLESVNKLTLKLAELLDKQSKDAAKRGAIGQFKMPTKPKRSTVVKMQGKKNDPLGIR